MRPLTKVVIGITLVGALAGGFVLANTYFLPEASTVVTETQSADSNRQVLKSGEFSGKAGHRVTGSITLFEEQSGYSLLFKNYEQTQGPDVYVYLTPAEDPDSVSEIRTGRKILIDGGAEGGESTKEGTFVQRLPPNLDPDQYNGVAIWCDRFSVPFGAAPLKVAG